MIINSLNSALKNIKDNFYYCGIEISKRYFDITEFAGICDKINDLKNYIFNEKELNILKNNFCFILKEPLNYNNSLYISFYKDKLFISIYNDLENKFCPLTRNILKYFNNELDITISHHLEILAKQYQNKIINYSNNIITRINDKRELTIFQIYQENIEKSPNCFYHTYELEFINGYQDYILTDERLKTSIKEI